MGRASEDGSSAPREHETLLDTLAAVGMESPFAPDRLDAVEKQLRAELTVSGLAQ